VTSTAADYRAPSAAPPWYGAARPAARIRGERLALAATALAVALLPLAIPHGPSNLAPIDGFIVIAIGATLLCAVNGRLPWRVPYAIPVGLALLGGAIGALVGPVPAAGLIALLQDILLLLWCWTIVNICHNAANLRVILTTWVYSGIAWAIVGCVGLVTGSALLTGQIPRQGTRLQLTLNDPSYAANYFFISIMIMWATQRPAHRLLRWAAYATLLIPLAATGSNSGIVAITVGTILASTLGVYRRSGAAGAVAMLAGIVLVGALLVSTVSLTNIQDQASTSKYAFIRAGIGRSPQSTSQRESLVSESVGLYKRGNVLGDGPVSTKPRLTQEEAPLIKEAHDDYFAALIERGPLGFIGILLFVCSVLGRGFFVATKSPRDLLNVIPRPNALMGAAVGTLIGGTVYELLHVRHIWALYAVVAAAALWRSD
jgi:hypothetical protein